MCCLNVHRFSVAKIGSCFKTEEKIGKQQTNQTMNHHFLERIEEADPTWNAIQANASQRAQLWPHGRNAPQTMATNSVSSTKKSS